MEEINPTSEQNLVAQGYSKCLAMCMVAQAYNKNVSEDGMVTAFGVDHAIRHSLEEHGYKADDENFHTLYIEYAAHLLLSKEVGEKYAVEEYTGLISFLVGMGVASTMNLCSVPEVAVIPEMPDDFTVPESWLKEGE